MNNSALAVLAFLTVVVGVAFFLASKFKAKQKPDDPRIDPKAPSVPLPGPDEDVNQFMLRCVRDPLMMATYTDRNARINQCSILWRQKKSK